MLSAAASSSHADAERPARPSRQRLAWAELLAIDVLLCPHCGGRRCILSFITEPRTIRRILAHLELPIDPPPVTPATVGVAPDGQWWLDIAPADDEPACDTELDTAPDTDRHGDADERAPR